MLLWLAVAAVIGIQFVGVELDNPPGTGDPGAPPEVGSILRRACYDCHSNETRWPWYSRLAPVSWLIERDVREGRRELNFSKWEKYKRRRKRKKLKEIFKEVDRGDMPPWFYVAMHGDAGLDKAQKRRLTVWARSTREALKKKSRRKKSRSRRRR